MEAEQILKQAAQASASDIFIVAGLPVSYKVNTRFKGRRISGLCRRTRK